MGNEEITHASHYVEKVLCLGLGELSSRVHLVHDEGNIAGAEFLDEKVTEKVVIAREVAHVHDLGGPPC